MSLWTDQISPKPSVVKTSRAVKYVKQCTARKRRRAEKRDPETAPRQNRELYVGWWWW
jgi:hypothetical protein